MLRHVLQAASTGRPLQDSVSAAVTLGGGAFAVVDMVDGRGPSDASGVGQIKFVIDGLWQICTPWTLQTSSNERANGERSGQPL